VSCLTVTLGTAERLPMLARAIGAYATQSLDDRELVIVPDRPGDPVAALVAGFGRDDIRIVSAEPGLPLGALRNRSAAAAQGAILCQWDDDDLHHPDRLAAQLAALGTADAVVLQDVMLLDAAAGEMRWTNWAGTPGRGHPGTLMARRDALPLYPETGPEARLGEDLAVLGALDAAGRVERLAGAAQFYVYVSHGLNSWSAAHHAMLAETLAISRGLLLRREAALREGLSPFGLAGVRVMGSNGDAFTL
jgi:glycosyltransferase involved in cell wall biosynthesis